MENNNLVKAKKVVFIPPLSNVIVINVLDARLVDKIKFNPHKILTYGVNNFYNLMHRITQTAQLLKVQESNLKKFTEHILNTIVAHIMKASVEFETGVPIDAPLEFKLTKKDEEFLQSLKLNPGSLK